MFSSELGVVAKPGDMLDGKLVTVAGAGGISLNDNGQLAFIVGFADGSQAIVLATPVTDTTPPVIVPTVTGTLGNNGWYRSNVTVSWSVTDPESGIASSSGCGQTTLTTDTAGVTLTCSATNGVGLQASISVTIKIDKTPPIISGLPAPDCSIWPPNHKLVQVATVTAMDALSGLAPGSFQVTGSSNDPANGQIVITGGSSQFNVQLGADKGQIYTLTATASDLAGNTKTATAICTVPHDQGH